MIVRRVRIVNTISGREVFRELTSEQHERLLDSMARHPNGVHIQSEVMSEREL